MKKRNVLDTRSLFELSDSIVVSSVSDNIIVVDNVYKTPELIREYILASPAPIWKTSENTKNFIDYYDCKHDILFKGNPLKGIYDFVVDIILEHYWGNVDIIENAEKFMTNVFYNIDDCGMNISVPHIDSEDPSMDCIGILIPFNYQNEGDSWTSFYKQKDTSVLPIYENGTNNFDGEELSKWELLYESKHNFNQMIIFSGQCPHGSKHTSFIDVPRMNQVGFFYKFNH